MTVRIGYQPVQNKELNDKFLLMQKYRQESSVLTDRIRSVKSCQSTVARILIFFGLKKELYMIAYMKQEKKINDNLVVQIQESFKKIDKI